MIMHVFGLRWNAAASQEHKEQALAAIRSFPETIPDILELHAGTNLSGNSGGYETIGMLQFSDKASLAAYLQHPVHRQFVQWVAPLIEAVDLDLEIA